MTEFDRLYRELIRRVMTEGYEELGEKYGQVYFQRVVLGNAWQPLQPSSVERGK